MTGSDLYPVGGQVDESSLLDDPYPTYLQLLDVEPITWISSLQMWWIVRYDHIVEILSDSQLFTAVSPKSPIFRAFGGQMLSSDGPDHRRYRNAAMPALQRGRLDTIRAKILIHTTELIDRMGPKRGADIRTEFATQLPVRVMCDLFGFPQTDAPVLRDAYDAFELALADFSGADGAARAASPELTRFHEYLRNMMRREQHTPSDNLLSHLLHLVGPAALHPDEVERNVCILLFGGISTVEALILNTLWCLCRHGHANHGISIQPDLIPPAIEEVMRFQSPVHSATRYVAMDCEFHGHRFTAGDTVNCILAAGNRDPTVFMRPNEFDIARPSTPRHLGFATGPHVCIGLHLARIESCIAIEQLLNRMPRLRLHPTTPAILRGYEFRKPVALRMTWD